MRALVLVLVLLGACDQGAKSTRSGAAALPSIPTGGWPAVEAQAKPLVPEGPTELIEGALATITNDDVPEGAIEKLYAWVDAGGGIPFRAQHTVGEIVTTKLHLLKLGEAALARRATDPRTVPAVMYLAHRMRAEGGCAIDVTLGFELVTAARKLSPDGVKKNAALAPTAAEVRRAVVIEALCARWIIDNDWSGVAGYKQPAQRGIIGDATIKKAAMNKRSDDEERARALVALQDLALSAPSDRRALAAHMRTNREKYADSWVALIVVGDVLPKHLDAMNAELDAFGVP